VGDALEELDMVDLLLLIHDIDGTTAKLFGEGLVDLRA
jgi:hypothetical protein